MLPFRVGGGRSRLEVLCLGAHSDDVELGCGGTLLQLAASPFDLRIEWIVFSATGERRMEARDSAHELLSEAESVKLTVLELRDGFLPDSWAAVKEAVETIASASAPDLILTHRRDDRHQDHRTVADATWSAFRDHLILEYEVPKYDGDLGRPNLYIPLTEGAVRRKARHVLSAFPSQRAKNWMTEETITSLARLRGIEAGATYAEAFYSSKAVLDLTDALE